MRKIFLLVSVTMCLVSHSIAQPCSPGNTWLGITNDWFIPANWCNGTVPTSTADVSVPGGTPNQPVINAAGAACHTITIASGGTLTINGTNTLSVSGDWTNNGSFNANNSTVSFTANTAVTQTLAGNTTFYNLSKPNANSTLSFANTITTIANNLSVSGGSMSGGTSTIIFTGNPASLQGNSTKDFYNLEISTGAVLTQTAGTNVNISSSYKNNGTFIQNNNRTITFQTASQTFSGSGASTFGNVTVSGPITVNAGTHDFSVLGTFNLSTASGVFNGGSAKITFAGSTAALGAGPGVCNFSNVTISGTLSNSSNKSFSITGNWLNNGSYTAGNETITLNGGSQIIGGSSSTVFSNLTVAGNADKTLENDVTINNTLTLINRSIDANTNAKSVYVKGTLIRNTSGHIIGNLKKDISAGANINKLFEIGTSTYAPAIFNFSTVATPGSLTVRTENGDDPNIGTSTLDVNKSVNRYWTLTSNGIDAGNYDVMFEFLAADIDAGANANNFKIGKYSGSTWTYPTAINVDATHIKATALTGFSDFAIAEPACIPPSISDQPLASQTKCQNEASTNLAIMATGDGLSYQWYVDNDNTGFDGNPVGSNSSSFTAPTNAEGTSYYYCVVTGTCGTTTSDYSKILIIQLTSWYRDADGDGFGDASNSTQACAAPIGYVVNNADCNDDDNTVYPGATEICDGKDNDCNGTIDEDIKTTFYRDADGDGFGDASNSTQACTAPIGYVINNADCNDDDNTVYPGATEICDGKDNDCNGTIDEDIKTTFYRDADGDGFGDASNSTQACTPPIGYVINNVDCNDDDNTVYPGATEICDGKDNDCNGTIDDDIKTTFYRDGDGDGFGDASNSTQACTAPTGYVSSNTDCNDADPSVYPDAPEICDSKDNDCNGSVDDNTAIVTFYQDADGDGYGNSTGLTLQSCSAPEGYVSNNTDCDDSNPAIHPGAPEICDGKDNNCDGQVDEGFDTDGDGFTVCMGDCNDNDGSIYPGASEICDGKDNDCNGTIDENAKTTFYRDADGDSYGDAANSTQACFQPEGYVSNSLDCNDAKVAVYPGAPELCDGLDNNCNGQVDEEAANTYYRDADGDGYGNAAISIKSCNTPWGYVNNNTDCNDGNKKIHPGATEVCGNVIDENCNGQVDEGCITTVKVCTYSQSCYDGNTISCTPNGVSSSLQIMLNAIHTQAGDSMIFGSKISGRFFTLKKSDIQNGYIYRLLPGIGPPKALKGYSTFTKPETWSNVPLTSGGMIQNELLAQMMTLFFNLQVSPQLSSLPLNTKLSIRKLSLCMIPGNLIQAKFTAKAAVVNCLQTKYGTQEITVSNLYKLANELLGNINSCNLNYSDVNDAIRSVNESFNGCVLINVPPLANNDIQSITGAIPEKNMIQATGMNEVSELKVTTSPNPFRNNIRFTVISPETGKLRILIYDVNGIKVKELEQDVIKKIAATIWFRTEQLRQGQLFYQVLINNKTTTGKIMQVN